MTDHPQGDKDDSRDDGYQVGDMARRFAEVCEVDPLEPLLAQLVAAGDGLAKLIADGTAGHLDADMAALSQWARACQELRR